MIKLCCYTQWFLLFLSHGFGRLELAAAGQGLVRNFRFRHNQPPNERVKRQIDTVYFRLIFHTPQCVWLKINPTMFKTRSCIVCNASYKIYKVA